MGHAHDLEVARLAIGVWAPHLRTLYDVCDMVRERPALYLPVADPASLAAFLRGWTLCSELLGRPIDPGDPPFPRFAEWWAARLGWREEAPDLADVAAQAGADLDAVWAELRVWRSRVPRQVATAPVPPGPGRPEAVAVWVLPEDDLAWLEATPGGKVGPLRRGAQTCQRLAEMMYGVTGWDHGDEA